MPKSLAQIESQIAKLQKEAQALKARDVAAAVAKVKALIAEHQLTADDIGLGKASAQAATRAPKAPKAPKAARPAAAGKTRRTRKGRAVAKADAATKTTKPAKAAKAAKAVKAAKVVNKRSAAGKRTQAAKGTLTTGVIKYRDDAGNAWTGRGKRPQWYLNALAAGKTPEQLLANAAA